MHHCFLAKGLFTVVFSGNLLLFWAYSSQGRDSLVEMEVKHGQLS